MELVGEIQVQPICILDRKVKMLKNRETRKVKVQWTHYELDDSTWELEEVVREAYTHLFYLILKKYASRTMVFFKGGDVIP